jgi:hypothetical protein
MDGILIGCVQGFIDGGVSFGSRLHEGARKMISMHKPHSFLHHHNHYAH